MITDQTHEQAAQALKLMAHPFRLSILFALSEQPSTSVTELQERLKAEQSKLSHHLIKLKDNSLLVRSREGANVQYALADPELIKQVREVVLKSTWPD